MSLILKMTEVQPRLSRILQDRTDVTQVIYGRSNSSVIALVPWLLYSSWRQGVIRQGHEDDEVVVIPKTMNMHDATRLFLSYREQLAPLLSRSQNTMYVVEVLVHDEPVGAILSWQDWLRFAPIRISPVEDQDAEEASEQERTYTIVTAAKHMSQFPAQFEREQKRGYAEAITVTKHDRPVLAIVPWELYKKFLRLQGPSKEDE